MIDWRPHRLWLCLMALALIIGIGNAPILGIAQQKAAQKRADLRAQNAKMTEGLQQLQQDIVEVEKMRGVMNDETADRFLAPVDRLRAAQILERRAAETRLSHLTYTVSPEHKMLIDTLGAGKQELAASELTLQADAPTDIDAYAFLDALRHTLPGRFTLRQFSLQRIGAVDAPITDANLRFTAKGEWLSNGASQNLAQVAP